MSYRQWGLLKVISHDGVVTGDQCSGTLVDIRGQVIGINIVRVDLAQTLVIPYNAVRGIACGDASCGQLSKRENDNFDLTRSLEFQISRS